MFVALQRLSEFSATSLPVARVFTRFGASLPKLLGAYFCEQGLPAVRTS
jgi:hypothetical protein